MRAALRWAALGLVLLGALGAAAPAQRGESLVLTYEGGRLIVRQTATVSYSDLSSMLEELPRTSLAGRYAVTVLREAPRELVGYVLAVERAGTLSVGGQHHEWDPGDRRYRLMRGELYRSYQPLEGRPRWTWLVAIPVNREAEASLLIEAVEGRWPIKTVSISPDRQND